MSAQQPEDDVYTHGHHESVVRAHAAWALGKLGGMKAKEILEKRLGREGSEVVRKEIKDALLMA